jgi:hypothetical protein
MAVNLSPVGGVAAQFFTNTGAVLTGGKIYTYLAGTTTPVAAYTTSAGNVAWTNPIVLDAAGRVPSGGEIWLTVGITYKFVLKDSTDVLIGTYDNISSAFNTDASLVSYTPAGTGAVTTNVQAKLRQYVSVKDFGAVGDGVTDDTAAIVLALNNGGHVVFPTGTYKVTTVVINNVDNLSVDASSAQFTSIYGNLFSIQGCDNFQWNGGKFNAGTGKNPAYDIPGTPTVVPSNFTVFQSNIAVVSNMIVINTPSNPAPCITAWNVGQIQINNNQLFYGGDNTIWAFGCFHVTSNGNLILNQERGRGICYQQTNQGAMVGNVVAEGKGDALNVHGSANIAITGNSVYNMTTDTAILQLGTGISIEWDENASPTTIAAAVADPQLYNSVFSRNITVSGNTVAKVPIGLRIGNNAGITGNNYGNQGQVVVDGNNFFGLGQGILTGTSRQIRISNNMISTSNTACVELSMATDTGGFKSQNIYIANNRFSQFNINLLGYNAIQFQGGTPLITQQFVITDNEWDNGNGGAGLCNIALSTYGLNARNNSYAAGTTTPVLSNQVAPFNYQPQFADQTGANALAGMFIPGTSTDFTQTGAVGDSFTTVFTMPTGSSVAAQIQIGNADRLVCWGMIYAQNGDTPSLTFTGTGGATYVQMSGSNIQIKGNTSSGAAPYGGYYSIKYSLLKPA